MSKLAIALIASVSVTLTGIIVLIVGAFLSTWLMYTGAAMTTLGALVSLAITAIVLCKAGQDDND